MNIDMSGFPTGTSIHVSEDGTIAVDGVPAVTATLEHRQDEDGDLQVRILLSPVGTDAVYAGRMAAVFTLEMPPYTVPFTETDKATQNEKAALYASSMIKIMAGLVGEHLTSAFTEASGEAAVMPEKVRAMADLIAAICLHIADNDPAKAKVVAVEQLAEFTAEKYPDLDDEAREALLAVVHHRIDAIADEGGE